MSVSWALNTRSRLIEFVQDFVATLAWQSDQLSLSVFVGPMEQQPSEVCLYTASSPLECLPRAHAENVGMSPCLHVAPKLACTSSDVE